MLHLFSWHPQFLGCRKFLILNIFLEVPLGRFNVHKWISFLLESSIGAAIRPPCLGYLIDSRYFNVSHLWIHKRIFRNYTLPQTNLTVLVDVHYIWQTACGDNSWLILISIQTNVVLLCLFVWIEESLILFDQFQSVVPLLLGSYLGFSKGWIENWSIYRTIYGTLLNNQ